MPKNISSEYNPQFGRVSRHASRRMSQRGIRTDLMRTLYWRGEESCCGGRARALTISEELASELRAEGLDAGDVDRLRRMRAVLSQDGELVTVMHRYRRRNRLSSRVERGGGQ